MNTLAATIKRDMLNDRNKNMKNEKLKWCDPSCEYARFPEEGDLDGACHTFIALYCTKYKRLVHKSALCLDITKENENEK
jgi:hypothetical protein